MDTVTAGNVGMSNAAQEKQAKPKTEKELIILQIKNKMLKNYEERMQKVKREDKLEELLSLNGYCDCIIELLSILNELEK